MLVDLDTARAHLRLDSDVEDELVALYLGAAEEAAQQYLNAVIYPDEPTRSAALVAAPAALSAAIAAYEQALDDAVLLTDRAALDFALESAGRTWGAALARSRMVLHGITVTEAIRAAILLTLGHLYANREDVLIGVTAVELPGGARALLFPYRAQMGV